MTKVHILPPDVINKIAAGEVIERPASVLKELIENALDAQTTSIIVHLEEAGKSLLHIKDTGGGIEIDDMETIFLRHSTSKIKNFDDLFATTSLGFRGEALYSVCAIADVVLRSRPPHQETGWEIHMRAGKKLKLHPLPMPAGTEIEVRELFFNTPARRKFLKTNTTELNQVLNTFIPYTLLYPACRFLLTHEGKTLLDLPPQENHITRIAKALNVNQRHLMEVSQDFPKEEITVHMVLGDINIKRNRRDMQYIFINNRPVQNQNVSFHMNQIYRLIFPPQQYPCFVLFITLNPAHVDVNIHPAKREVKIKDDTLLTAILRAVCEETLLKKGLAKQVVISPAATRNAPTDNPGDSPSKTFDQSSAQPATQGVPPKSFDPASYQELFKVTRENFLHDISLQTNQIKTPEAPSSKDEPSGVQETLFTREHDTLRHKLADAKYIGGFIRKYLLFESANSLFIIDQHAAQERINYEKFKRQVETGTIDVQHLLTPILLKLTSQEILMWEGSQEKLIEIGLETTRWDNETVALHTHPSLIQDPGIVTQAILSGDPVPHYDHNILARRACRSSVMAGDSMNKEQADYQRRELLNCHDPFSCPHGRPTAIELEEKFLDRQFLRT